jgi:hypothetical protein
LRIWLFDSAIRVAREALWFCSVNWPVLWPWPSAKLGAPVVLECLLKFGSSIHNKGPVLRYGLAYWSALQQQEFNCLRTCNQFNLAVRSKSQAGI